MARATIPAHILSISQNLGLPVSEPEKIRITAALPEDFAQRLCSMEGGNPVPVRSRLFYLQKGAGLLVFSYFFQGAKPGRALGALYVGNIPKTGWSEKPQPPNMQGKA